MRLAVLDTETTGFVKSSYKDKNTSRIASLTVIIYDTELKTVQASLNTMIKPDDWEMSSGAERVNGLSTQMLNDFGVCIKTTLSVFDGLIKPCSLIVGHNVRFDIKMLASEYYRNEINLGNFISKELYCTMNGSKDIVQAKNKIGHLKNPKLIEAYKFFFDADLESAHSANADAIATLEVYLAIQKHNKN